VNPSAYYSPGPSLSTQVASFVSQTTTQTQTTLASIQMWTSPSFAGLGILPPLATPNVPGIINSPILIPPPTYIPPPSVPISGSNPIPSFPAPLPPSAYQNPPSPSPLVQAAAGLWGCVADPGCSTAVAGPFGPEVFVGANLLAGVAGLGLRVVGEGVDALPGAAESTGVDLSLTYKPGWSAAKRTEADVKVQILNDGETVVTQSTRSGTSAASRYRSAGNQIPAGSDVDHAIDLQLGGSDTVSNMWPLNSSVNRSLGAQIQQQIKNIPPGTVINKVTIGDR